MRKHLARMKKKKHTFTRKKTPAEPVQFEVKRKDKEGTGRQDKTQIRGGKRHNSMACSSV